MRVTICDRCGKRIEMCEASYYIELQPSNKLGDLRSNLDLCERCYEKLIDFLEAKD